MFKLFVVESHWLINNLFIAENTEEHFMEILGI